MIHSFDTEVANQVGINAAVILQNLFFWCRKNEANEKNYHHGTTWTYNSVQAFSKLFPYMKKYTISKSLTDLEEQGYIISGNFNKIAYDRTKWYAVTDKTISILDRKISEPHLKNTKQSIVRKLEMDSQETRNGFLENGQPIPDSKQKDNKQRLKTTKGSSSALIPDSEISSPEKIKHAVSSERLMSLWNKTATAAGLSKIQKITARRRKHISARLEILPTIAAWRSLFSKVENSPFLTGDNDRGWTCSFDWLIENEDNPTKVMEDKYNFKEPKKKRTRITNDVRFGTVYGEPDKVINNQTEGE